MPVPHDEHPDEQHLWNLARERDDPVSAAHVASCASCQQDLEALMQIARYREVTEGRLADVPSGLHDSLVGLFVTVRPDLVSHTPSPVDRVRQVLRQVVAEILLDTGSGLQPVGLRSGAQRGTRQLAFVSEVADLDLEVIERRDGRRVAGQLGLDTVVPGLRIRFSPSDPGAAVADVEAAIEDDGHFSLDLSSGEWVASVRMDDVLLVFPGVRL